MPLVEEGLRGPLSLLGRVPDTRWGRALLAALSGTLLFLSCADFDIWPLCWVGLVPLLLALFDAGGAPRSTTPFLDGLICGLLANGGGFYWIIGLLMRFGHMPFAAALPIFCLLIAYQALTFALFTALLSRARCQLDLPITFIAPVIFTACELSVPYIFPWYLAITQAWNPLVIQVADMTGPLGVSFLLVLANGALFDLIARRRGGASLRAPAAAGVIILLALAYGAVRIYQVDARRARAEKIRIGVVQANIGIHEKFVPELRAEQLRVHHEESARLEAHGAELIVWPESSYPYPIRRPVTSDFPPDDPRRVRRGLEGPLLFGALTIEAAQGRWVPYNTALMMDEHGRVRGSFDKNFLLIFGEYIPYAEHLAFLRELIPEISNFARGTTTTTFPLTHRGREYRIGPMICYEDIIPAFGRRLFDTSTPPNLLINITNDAWFGATSEPYEHLALSVFRAVEHRVDMIRAVNTGVSAFIDAAGRVYQKGPSVDPQLTRGAGPTSLLAEAALMTPGGLYQRLGDTFGGICLVITLLLSLLARKRAGMPVRLRWVAGGALGLHGALFLLALFSRGGLSLVHAAVFHRNEGAFSEGLLFRTGVQALAVLCLAGALCGAALRVLGLREKRVSKEEGQPGRIEAVAAILCVTVLPVVFFGRMEGNTGAVVIMSLIASLSTLLGGRMARSMLASSLSSKGGPP